LADVIRIDNEGRQIKVSNANRV
jgi:hypothetical protein